MNRRDVLSAISVAAATGVLAGATRFAHAAGVDVNAILNDPADPTAGNPKGDVTIVTFFDYNCPFCKKYAPDLQSLVRTDGHIRLVYKDWPILTPASVYGARAALAAKYQDRYEAVHHALMGIAGRRVSEASMSEAVAKSGVDVARLAADQQAHSAEIDALLRKHLAQANAMGLQGTPTYLVGPFLIAQSLDLAGFKRAVDQARERQAAK